MIAVLVAVLIVACTTSEGPESAATTTSTRMAAESEAESSTAGSAPYRTGRLASGALVEGDTRWLAAPNEPTTKRLGGDCSSLADSGWGATCERVTTELGDAVWLREERGDQERVSLYVRRTADAWDLALQATDDSGREFDSKVFGADLAGDANRKVVVTLKRADMDATDQVPAPVEVAVVEPTGEIVVHLVLQGGRGSGSPGVTVRPGEGLEVRDCSVDCVPTAPMRVRVIAYTPDGWRVVDQRFEQ